LHIDGAIVLNDCYNSNPAALRAMVDTLLTIPAQRRIVVAGEMLELGSSSAQLHRECGEYMAKRGIDVVLGVRGEATSIAAPATIAPVPVSPGPAAFRPPGNSKGCCASGLDS